MLKTDVFAWLTVNCYRVFLLLRCKNLLKVAAFVLFSTSIVVLFEIYQRFKGLFLNELRVSFKKKILTKRFKDKRNKRQ